MHRNNIYNIQYLQDIALSLDRPEPASLSSFFCKTTVSSDLHTNRRRVWGLIRW